MNRHYAQGFRRDFLNDLNDVEPQLQAYDEHLYLMYNGQTGEHLIMDGMTDLAVMRIPQPGWTNLNSSIVEHIRKIHTQNGHSAVREIERHDARREAEQERRKTELAEDFAKNMFEADKKSIVVNDKG